MAHNICGDSAARLPAEEVAPVKLFVLGNQVGENTINPEKQWKTHLFFGVNQMHCQGVCVSLARA